MQNDSNSVFQPVVQRIAPGSELIISRPLTGGVSAEIHALQFALKNGEKKEVVVRRHGASEWKLHGDDVASMEFALQTILYEAGLPVAEPLMLDVSCELLPSPYFVMAMVEGDMKVQPNQVPEAISAMADFLLRLHRLDISTMELPATLRRNEDPIQGALSYIPDTRQYADLRSVVHGWQITPKDPSLLHGDYWPNNIIWSGGEIKAVLDWEDASTGSPESDLACCRSELMVMYGEEAMHQFTEQYLIESTADVSDLPIWEVYSSFAALATMSEWGLPADVEAHRRERTQQFAERAANAVFQLA